ncbi:bifunctional ADP-dependent NAD(P)H-hydrate dehydratase/NAD(P)H-hydrate epimerase [Auritidibacter ignavus]|uniref:bifunctional ADP-dependent NAD(P)H-hydrate dehydratase/NAD(P)H-hydrate epimerase n=1 Tax=Auritidibacter ignavus TaxID=678932 RepID=UPI002446DFBD|nr:bifunctional ADP-dependent NAD(P)H-hydrate dehydratase/NAD(P)H-hydrate epimerase [Auritidibacter ignavus]WGH90788.1 bifunctional ADP-dependent NAD(P)H-hydrate dehydratase/NAD(P)H-hydrate epimerase [Auritidibacter ignavus]
MKKLYFGTSVRKAEAPLIARGASALLMRRAAWGLAHHVLAYLSETAHGAVYGSRVVGLIGKGKNGADTLWALSMLAERGVSVEAIAVLGNPEQNAQDAVRAFHRAGGRFVTALGQRTDVVIDGVLGTGASGPFSMSAVLAQRGIDRPRPETTVIACDIPSGINADTGQLDGDTLTATATVTFGATKTGLLLSAGHQHAGRVHTVDIGLQEHLSSQPTVWCPDPHDVTTCFPPPRATDYKYSRGVVGIIAGSEAYPGASLLCSRAVASCGIGMVNLIADPETVPSLRPLVLGDRPETVVTAAPVPQVTSLVIGPGLDDTSTSRQRLDEGLDHAVEHDLPVVIDATGLDLVDQGWLDRLRLGGTSSRTAPTVLTPHLGEMSRLSQRFVGTEAVPATIGGDKDALAWATALAQATGCYVVLKAADTVVATPSGQRGLHPAQSADLATAGTGDTLAGLIAVSLATAWTRTNSPVTEHQVLHHVLAAIHLHGAAAVSARHAGPVSASDLAPAVRAVLASRG